MTALDLLDDSFPHGTLDGFANGCRTNHCPAPIVCHEFRRRYVSDWAFRKQVDAGATAADIAAVEATQAEARAQAERDANKRIRNALKREQKASVKMQRYRYGTQVRATPVPYTADEITTIRELNSEGLTDTEIAAAMGRPFGSLTAKRAALGLPRNKPKTVIPHGTYAGYAAGCRATCCHEPAKAYWRANADKKRRRDGVPMKEEIAA